MSRTLLKVLLYIWGTTLIIQITNQYLDDIVQGNCEDAVEIV